MDIWGRKEDKANLAAFCSEFKQATAAAGTPYLLTMSTSADVNGYAGGWGPVVGQCRDLFVTSGLVAAREDDAHPRARHVHAARGLSPRLACRATGNLRAPASVRPVRASVLLLCASTYTQMHVPCASQRRPAVFTPCCTYRAQPLTCLPWASRSTSSTSWPTTSTVGALRRSKNDAKFVATLLIRHCGRSGAGREAATAGTSDAAAPSAGQEAGGEAARWVPCLPALPTGYPPASPRTPHPTHTHGTGEARST